MKTNAMKEPKTNARDRRLKNNAIASLAREKMAHQRDNWTHEADSRVADLHVLRARNEADLEKSKRRQAESELKWIANGTIERREWDSFQEFNLQVRVPTRRAVTGFPDRAVMLAMKQLLEAATRTAHDIHDMNFGMAIGSSSSCAMETAKYRLFNSDSIMRSNLPLGVVSDIFDGALTAIKEAASKVDQSAYPIQRR